MLMIVKCKLPNNLMTFYRTKQSLTTLLKKIIFVICCKIISFRILPDYRNLLCKNMIESGTFATWDVVFKLFKESNVPSERTGYLMCLGYATNPWLLNRWTSSQKLSFVALYMCIVDY